MKRQVEFKLKILNQNTLLSLLYFTRHFLFDIITSGLFDLSTKHFIKEKKLWYKFCTYWVPVTRIYTSTSWYTFYPIDKVGRIVSLTSIVYMAYNMHEEAVITRDFGRLVRFSQGKQQLCIIIFLYFVVEKWKCTISMK